MQIKVPNVNISMVFLEIRFHINYTIKYKLTIKNGLSAFVLHMVFKTKFEFEETAYMVRMPFRKGK